MALETSLLDVLENCLFTTIFPPITGEVEDELLFLESEGFEVIACMVEDLFFDSSG